MYTAGFIVSTLTVEVATLSVNKLKMMAFNVLLCSKGFFLPTITVVVVRLSVNQVQMFAVIVNIQ